MQSVVQWTWPVRALAKASRQLIGVGKPAERVEGPYKYRGGIGFNKMTKKKKTFKSFLREDIPTVWDAAGVKFNKKWNIVRTHREEQEEGDQEALPPPTGEEDGYDEDRFAQDPEEGDVDLNDMANEEEPDVDPNKEGPSIRHVDGAHLVYKRENTMGTFDELWIYMITDGGEKIRDELRIRRDILNGTDIMPDKYSSEDGSQKLEIVTIGNAQLLKISGMAN